MRSNEVFARMDPERAQRFLEEIRTDAPATAQLALGAAAGAFRLRPEFLRRQPRARQAEWMRKALARRVSTAVAEEVLASYFLDYHADLLVALLDALGVEHEEGRLEKENPPCPDRETLSKVVSEFASGEDAERRRLLLEAFAAQSAIDWPDLDALLFPEGAAQ